MDNIGPAEARAYQGAFRNKGHRSTCPICSKTHSLGNFDTTQEAALAYDRKARQCGEDKLLNYESIKAAEDAAHAAAQAPAEHALVHDMCVGPQTTEDRSPVRHRHRDSMA